MLNFDTFNEANSCPRRFFGSDRDHGKVDIPDLMQKQSYYDFLQLDVSPKKRKNKGLESVLRASFPISDYDNISTVEYVSYRIGDAKYDVEESLQRGVNYSAPLFLVLRIIIWEGEHNEADTHSASDGDIVDLGDTNNDASHLDSHVEAARKKKVETREVKSIKEQEVYLGDIPLMTDAGAFVVNGAQRVIVSQMHRSPGVFYFRDDGKSNVAGKYIYSARVIPYKGLWLDIEFDSRDMLYFRIDKKRKLPLSTLLMAMKLTKTAIMKEFYKVKSFKVDKNKKWVSTLSIADLYRKTIDKDIVHAKTGKVLISKGETINISFQRQFKHDGEPYIASEDEFIGAYTVEPIKLGKNEEGIEEEIPAGGVITEYAAQQIMLSKGVINIATDKERAYIRDTLVQDSSENYHQALIEIYKVMKGGESTSPDIAKAFFDNMFYGEGRYDLSSVGRMKINMKHGFKVSEDYKFLRLEDIIAFIKHLVSLKDGEGDVDDIDSLENRRVRCVGELLENQFRVAMSRIERSIFERMNVLDLDSVMLHDLVNIKALSSAISEFFGTSQLSQFMDQTNPLAEVTHKRRISALGPGGVTRERAGLEVRDVHYTHYGRLCPIESPEGQNIGLISSSSSYAIINSYGFIETPYFKVVNGKVTSKIEYLSAIEESRYTIAQANEELDKDNKFISEFISCRKNGDFVSVSPAEVNYIDVSPKQLVSVAASLIPFLENNDASRALMGANMQRQAVPLVQGQAPFVGTGMEGIVARNSGAALIAKRSGTVIYVDANRIIISVEDAKVDRENKPLIIEDNSFATDNIDVYDLIKYSRSNNNTVINQKAIVRTGDKVQSGQLLADSMNTDRGELALGRNVLVAFMPWNGYNFEDSILVSENVIKEGVFTSLQIQQYDIVARDTMLGPEEITRSVPGVSEHELRHLDESGIVRIGAKVSANDIIVGKVAPKSESPLMPEEKLLRAIFGEKVADVKDASLRISPGDKGTVIGVWIFTRRGVDKNDRALSLDKQRITKKVYYHEHFESIVTRSAYENLRIFLAGKEAKVDNKVVAISHDILESLDKKDWWKIDLAAEEDKEEVAKMHERYENLLSKMKQDLEIRSERLQSGDDMAQGALQVVKVLIATEMKLQPGDKMAGRHGNKGVVSRIVPVEDMPFLDDGTPVDIVLNPIGVPSRMNVGQILETHLGWASVMLGKQLGELVDQYEQTKNDDVVGALRKKINTIYADSGRWANGSRFNVKKTSDDSSIIELAKRMRKGVPFATPVFDGAKEKDINAMLEEAKVSTSGQIRLRDGRTGEYFNREVTVGYIYMMKLDHLVQNKVHARSIGAYSLVTQQPLGGKSHFGGQRFGEMECWALEAYGAAYTLQEMLTVKSDDVLGRVNMYEKITKGEQSFTYGVPESFNVMVKELRSLAINIEPVNSKDALLSQGVGDDSSPESSSDEGDCQSSNNIDDNANSDAGIKLAEQEVRAEHGTSDDSISEKDLNDILDKLSNL